MKNGQPFAIINHLGILTDIVHIYESPPGTGTPVINNNSDIWASGIGNRNPMATLVKHAIILPWISGWGPSGATPDIFEII